MKKEIWKDVKNYEGLYEVSNLGRVKSLNYNRTRKEKILKSGYVCGYCKVVLWKNGKRKYILVHRLVAEHFIPNIEDKPCIDHIDGNPMNNRVENLRWCTYKENSNNPITLQRMSEAQKGEKHPMYGKHHTEETKKKISENLKGENNHFYGKHHTEETKKKISEAHTNGKHSKPVLQIDKDTNEVIAEFPSMAEVQRQLGFANIHISQCCNGKRKTCGGFKWRYATTD